MRTRSLYASVFAAALALGLAGCGDDDADTLPPPDDVAAPPADATVTESGLAYRVLDPGDGPRTARLDDVVTVDYAGWTTDGALFDSSLLRGTPATFAVTGVIPGWVEALQLMREGDRFRLWIPEALAYDGAPNRPAGMLVFDVTLLAIAE